MVQPQLKLNGNSRDMADPRKCKTARRTPAMEGVECASPSVLACRLGLANPGYVCGPELLLKTRKDEAAARRPRSRLAGRPHPSAFPSTSTGLVLGLRAHTHTRTHKKNSKMVAPSAQTLHKYYSLPRKRSRNFKTAVLCCNRKKLCTGNPHGRSHRHPHMRVAVDAL